MINIEENKPKISIITVVYNGAEFLEQTIKSIINQTYKNISFDILSAPTKQLEVRENYLRNEIQNYI
jgi:GT2 family glycosyltransferase